MESGSSVCCIFGMAVADAALKAALQELAKPPFDEEPKHQQVHFFQSVPQSQHVPQRRRCPDCFHWPPYYQGRRCPRYLPPLPTPVALATRDVCPCPLPGPLNGWKGWLGDVLGLKAVKIAQGGKSCQNILERYCKYKLDVRVCAKRQVRDVIAHVSLVPLRDLVPSTFTRGGLKEVLQLGPTEPVDRRLCPSFFHLPC